MTTRWEKTWEIFHAAVELPEAERQAYLHKACEGDLELIAEVESLLRSHQQADELPDPDAFLSDLPMDEELAVASAGQQIGPYRIVREVGQGGMGVVYEAEQEQLKRRVALKLIRLGMDTRQVVARFEAERETLAMMRHPNIAQVLDAGATESGRPYFVMEFIDGEPITSYCDAHRLSTTERLDLFLAVCSGVQHAHQKGIIHRDLKPTNILVTREDGRPVPKIIDFGIAKATAQRLTEKTLFTQAGVLIGTPEYMSPEQAGLSELDVDTRTDVYSLGVLLYELLVGALPFEPSELRGAGYDEIRRRIREEEPSRPSARLSTLEGLSADLARNRRTDSPSLMRQLRGDLDWITMRALEKVPDRRYPSPSELAADLRRHLHNEPVQAGPPAATYRMGKFVRRHKLAVTAGSAVLLALLLGATAATFGLVRARDAERAARKEARTADEVSDFLTSLFRVSQPSAANVNQITAREILDRGVERIESELTREPEVQSRLMREMGMVYAQLGLHQEAERLFQQALDIRRELPQVTDLQIAEILANLAGVDHLAGRHEEAIERYKESVQLAEAAGERDDLWLAMVLRSLGGVYLTLARNDEALATSQRARSMLEATDHAEDPEFGRILRNIGMAHWSLQEFDAARTAYEESLDVYDASLEPGHPEISYVVNSLAILNYNLKDFDAARPMFERELANLERTLGHEHPNTASIMNNLGLLLLEMELLAEARPRLQESLRIREAALGPEHEDVATSLVNLGRLLLAEGDLEGAQRSFQRCLAIREKRLGPEHPYVATVLEVYSEVLRQLGKDQQAAVLEQRASAIRDAGN